MHDPRVTIFACTHLFSFTVIKIVIDFNDVYDISIYLTVSCILVIGHVYDISIPGSFMRLKCHIHALKQVHSVGHVYDILKPEFH